MKSKILRKIHIICMKTIIQFDNQTYTSSRKDKTNTGSNKIKFQIPIFISTLSWTKCKLEKYTELLKSIT